MKNIFLVTILIFLIACTKNNEGEILQLNYDLNEEFVIIYKSKIVTKNIGSINYLIDSRFALDSITDNLFTFKTKIEKLEYESNLGGTVETFDSNLPDSLRTESQEMIYLEFKELLENDYLITVNKYGKIVSPFKSKNGNSQSNLLNMDFIQIEFPEKKLKKGSYWNVYKQTEFSDKILTYEYYVWDINSEKITITLSANLGSQYGLDERKLKGEYTLDYKTKKLIRAEIEADLKSGGHGKMKIEINTK